LNERGSVIDRQGGGREWRRALLPPCLAAALPILLLSCQPYTTRPAFGPLPGAAEAVVDLDVARATTVLAEQLRSDSIPVSRVEPKDGYLETEWFSAVTGQPTNERVLGDSIVRVRGWVNAYGSERGSIRVETALRPLANPSLPPRDLDRQAPADNPVAIRVAKVLTEMAKRYPVPGAEEPTTAAPRVRGDSTQMTPTDSAAGKPIPKGRPANAR
jgi:hypothetical protein